VHRLESAKRSGSKRLAFYTSIGFYCQLLEGPLHRRYQRLNIPIEIMRTVVAISETGSLSKAADRLGLSQPAISSQIKRLQGLVGGALFLKTANGTTVTELGMLALQQARRILEAHDQLLRLGGNSDGVQPLRLGLSTLFVQKFIRRQTLNRSPASLS
jgi:molybdenum-dependent DNA-binding transcriptional regulator ModE